MLVADVMHVQKKAICGIFLFSLLFHSMVFYTLFLKSECFSKYQNFASQYVHNAINNERLLDFSPLYLYIHVIAQKYLSYPNDVIIWLQFLCTACSSVLFFLLLRSFFSFLIALAGTAAFVTSRSVLLYTGTYEPEALLIFLLLGFMVCAQRKSRRAAFLSGVFLGSCLLIRLNLFPLIIIIPLFFLIRGGRGKETLQRAFVFILPCFFAIAFLMARNHMIIGTFSPIVMNPGYVFYEGNNSLSNGQNAVYPPMIDNSIEEFPGDADPAHAIYRFFPRRITGNRFSVAESNSFWMRKAMNFIVDHPGCWAERICRKMYYIFHNSRQHDIASVIANDRRLQKSLIPAIPFGVISAMALIGMVLSLKAWKERFVIYAVIVCQMSVMVLTYASDRQRVSILALFVFFAAETLQYLVRENRSPCGKIIVSVLVLSFSFFFFVKDDQLKDGTYGEYHFEQAQKAIEEALSDRNGGKLRQAAEENATAHALLPYFVELRYSGLGFAGQSFQQRALAIAESLYTGRSMGHSSQLDLVSLYLENGRNARAESLLNGLISEKRRFNRSSSQSSELAYYLAIIREREGASAHPEAVACLKKALADNPGDPWVLSHLSVLTGDTFFKDRITRYFDEIDAEYFMGHACLANGRFEEAAKNFSYVAEKVPEYRDGLIYLSIALGANGDFDGAARMYIKAMQKKGEPLFGEEEIVDIFRQWVNHDPRSTEARYYLGVVLRDFGHYDEALQILKNLIQENHSMDSAGIIKRHIEWLEKAVIYFRSG
jgi:tetratricopeptide (TPR) repeat protein